ncbi:class I adenylate-forming enzyme family protein [Streptosporangium sp. NPDC087985]|uniref:class I adenylate-forming enzyme family protein n=1 Tax=Streptosporangium sp. NPDC087985 TaxID=3366196 RepID=UPI00380745E2
MTPRDRAVAVLARAGLLHVRDGHELLVLYTSGSTDVPRAVVRTVDSWTDSFDPLSEITGIRAADRVLIPAPLSSSLFAFAAAHTAAAGAGILDLPRWHPQVAAAAAGECTMAHVTPPMLDALLDRLPPGGPLRTVICGGAGLPRATRERADLAGIRVVDYYGAAELSFVAIRHPDGAMRAFPGAEIELRDEVVWVRSPFLAEGYDGRTTGPLTRDDEGWASVGDRAVWSDAEGLTVLGRGDEMVLTGGASVLPGDVEQVISDAPGVAGVVVVGLPHHSLGQVVTAVIVPSTDGPPSGSALRRHAAARLSPAHRPRRWYAVDQMPLTPAGKPARGRIRQGLADGTLGARVLP